MGEIGLGGRGGRRRQDVRQRVVQVHVGYDDESSSVDLAASVDKQIQLSINNSTITVQVHLQYSSSLFSNKYYAECERTRIRLTISALRMNDSTNGEKSCIKVLLSSSLLVYRLVHAPVIVRGTRESWVRLPGREKFLA
jgi:hypothetical protein